MPSFKGYKLSTRQISDYNIADQNTDTTLN